jgi:hypothetical protein
MQEINIFLFMPDIRPRVLCANERTMVIQKREKHARYLGASRMNREKGSKSSVTIYEAREKGNFVGNEKFDENHSL